MTPAEFLGECHTRARAYYGCRAYGDQRAADDLAKAASWFLELHNVTPSLEQTAVFAALAGIGVESALRPMVELVVSAEGGPTPDAGEVADLLSVLTEALWTLPQSVVDDVDRQFAGRAS